MIQLALVMVVLSILAAREVVKQVNAVADLQALAVGSGLEVMRNAGNDYLASYYDKIQGASGFTVVVAGTSVNVVAALAPTVPELLALGKLPFGATGTSLIAGGSYKFYVMPNPLTCVLPSSPGSRCNLDGMVCIDAPLRTRGVLDLPRAGKAIRRVGADGAYSTLEAPTVVGGLGGAWSTANPVPGSAAGIVCARFGYSSSAWAPFVRKDGMVAMTGNFDVGGKSIDNVVDVNGTGTIKGAQFLTDLKTVGGNCSNLGALASGNGVGVICDGAKWQIDAGIRAGAGSSCTQEGTTATSATTGELLICKNGRYVKLVSLLGKKVLIATAIVQDGTVVNMPTCDAGGSPDFSFDATQVTLDMTTSPPKQTMYWTALNASASTWVVQIRLKDNTGAEVSGNTVNLTNIMNLECRY